MSNKMQLQKDESFGNFENLSFYVWYGVKCIFSVQIHTTTFNEENPAKLKMYLWSKTLYVILIFCSLSNANLVYILHTEEKWKIKP